MSAERPHSPNAEQLTPPASISEGVSEGVSEGAARAPRRPYEPPAFVVSRAFERQALSCAGCLNQSASFPAFCAMRS